MKIDEFSIKVDELISKNKFKDAIKLMRELLHESPQLNEVLAQSGRFKELERQERLGIVDYQSATIEKNKIRVALLGLVEDIRENIEGDNIIKREFESIQPEKIYMVLEQPQSYTWAALSFGVAALVSLITISILLPEWTNNNGVLFKTLLALSVACVVVLLPGFLHFNISNLVKAGGSLGVFALVYFINPVDEQKAFDLTVNLTIEEGGIIVPLKSKGEELTLWLNGSNYKVMSKMNETGDVDFKKIPAEYKNKKAQFQLNSKIYKLKNPEAEHVLNSESIKIEVVPKLIERISGFVKEENAGLKGVKISLDNIPTLETLSNAAGEFSINIPVELQKDKFAISLSKEGYHYSASNKSYHETYDASSANKITVYLIKDSNVPPISKPHATGSKISLGNNSTATPNTEAEKSTTSQWLPLNLLYDNKKTSFPFPVDDNTVENLRSYICERIAVSYANNRVRCQIKHFGKILPLDQKIRNLNLPANTEIYLECEGQVIPMKSWQQFIIKGIKIGQAIVFINGKFASSNVKNGELVGFTSPSYFKINDNKNHLVIYDNVTREKFAFNNVRIPDDNNLRNSIIVFTVNANGTVTANIESTKVIVYENRNYKGESKIIYDETTRLMNSTDFNDRISSMKVPKGYNVLAYEYVNESGGYGKAIVLTQDCADLAVLGMDKKISFFEVRNNESELSKAKKTTGKMVWIDGHFKLENGKYSWMPGHWTRPPSKLIGQ